MFSTALIWFREVLEMALILSVVLAATRNIAQRGRYVLGGMAGGIFGSGLVALFAGELSDAFAGFGQEIFNGMVLLAASAMIGWTVVWMKQHGRQLSQHIREVGRKVQEGEAHLAAISLIVALSMWREGAELVLFMTGILSASTEPRLMLALGGAAGGGAAGIVGLLLYLGLIRLSPGRLFTVTGWMLTLLACGMTLQAVGFFSAAGLLPAWSNPVWDSGHFLPESALPGRILHTLVGYTEQPTLAQLLGFIATFMIIRMLARFSGTQPAKMMASVTKV